MTKKKNIKQQYIDSSLQYHDGLLTSDSTDFEIMMEWERPLMKRHAELVSRGAVLEIGFGLGISASYIVNSLPVTSYTLIEIHRDAVKKAQDFFRSNKSPLRRVAEIKVGDWYAELPKLGKFDGVFIDTVFDTKMRHFGRMIKSHLNPGAVVTMFSSRECQAWGFDESEIEYEEIPIDPPPNQYLNSKLYHLPIYRHPE